MMSLENEKIMEAVRVWQPKPGNESFWETPIEDKLSRLDVVRLWLAALLSDEYKQGTHALHGWSADENQCYCCLGVACEVLNTISDRYLPTIIKEVASFAGPTRELLEQGNLIRVGAYNGNVTVLPIKVAKALGLKTNSGYFIPTPESRCGSLVSMNDSNMSFKSIVEFILTEPKGLFDYNGVAIYAD